MSEVPNLLSMPRTCLKMPNGITIVDDGEVSASQTHGLGYCDSHAEQYRNDRVDRIAAHREDSPNGDHIKND